MLWRINKRVQVVAALVEGTSIDATCRMTGVAKHTVLKLLKDMGCACAEYHNRAVRNLHVRRIQCDEIWAFVYAKQKNVTLEQMQQGAGDVWTWTAIDADTKLIVSYMLGDRGAATAQSFMRDLAGRITNRFQHTTDGHRVYADAVEDAFGADIDYAMLVKIYGASNDSPESLVGYFDSCADTNLCFASAIQSSITFLMPPSAQLLRAFSSLSSSALISAISPGESIGGSRSVHYCSDSVLTPE